MSAQANILLILILVPLGAALVVMAAPAKRAGGIALVGTIVPFLMWCWGAFAGEYQWSAGATDAINRDIITWFEPLGIKLTLGADNVSMLLVGLTTLLGPICVACSFTAIRERVKTYYGWLLALQAAMTGVFLARDVVVFYVFFEFTLVPMYVLIWLYGSTNRKAAATKFFLYTFTGSIITLAGMVYLAWRHTQMPGNSGEWSLDFDALRRTANMLTASEQSWLLWAMLAGFAIKVPLFPVHTWLPLAHTEAPTAGSVVLAGVLLKLGTYGIYRLALPFYPQAAVEWAPTLAVLSIIGILYAGLICWVQTDVKKLVAYSSVSHLGFCVLGMVSLSAIGLSGSVLYMINHGLSTGALFLLIGMIYERYHTRSLKELGGLGAKMPIWSTFMVFFAMASVGLPGLNGFVGEIMCLLGAFQAGGSQWGAGGVAVGGVEVQSTISGGLLPGAVWGELGFWYALAAGVGMIITAVYILYMVGAIVWGPLKEPAGHGSGHGAHDHAHLPSDLTAREIGVLAPLAVLCLALGLYPKPMLDVLESPSRLMAESIHQGRLQRLANQLPPGVSPPMDTDANDAPSPPRSEDEKQAMGAASNNLAGDVNH